MDAPAAADRPPDRQRRSGGRLYEHVVGLGALALLVYACLQILAPFLAGILWGVTLSVATWPLFLWLRRRLGGRAIPAALLMTLLLAIVFVAPLVLLGVTLADGVGAVARILGDLTNVVIPPPPTWLVRVPVVGDDLQTRWLGAMVDLPAELAELRPYVGRMASWVLASGAALGSAALELLLAVIVAGVLYLRGEAAAELLRRLIDRIAGPPHVALVEIAARTIRGVANGVVGTAIVQSLLAAFGFAVAGIPGAALLALAVFMVSVLQGPTHVVTLGVALWTYLAGQGGYAIFLAAWGFLVVGGIDNFIRPLLISQGARLSLLLVFTGVIGGLLAYGVLGIFLGPVILAVAWTVLNDWLATPRAAVVPPGEG